MHFSMSPRSVTFCLLIIFGCLIFVTGHGHSHDHQHHHDEHPSHKYSKQANEQFAQHTHKTENKVKWKSRDTATLWVEALGSTLLISAAPFIILFFIPIDNRAEHEPLLKVLLSFASGGLLGDAFLHLIPHALLSHSGSSGSHSHSHSHSDVGGHDLSVGLGVLGGIVVFLMVEKFVRIVKGGHGHSHSPVVIRVTEKSDERERESGGDEREQESKGDEKSKTDKREQESGGDEKSKPDERERESEDEDKLVTETSGEKEVTDTHDEPEEDIKVAGYLNLAADFLHNFTDGLAIGASFLAGRGVGLITTVTILLHEVPHEIGDFAILLQSGCSKKKAIFLQLVTAIGALTGTAFSLFAEGIDERVSNLILPFTAGGFIYIATVSVIPELLEDTKFWQSVKEVIALLVGVFMMVLIAQYE